MHYMKLHGLYMALFTTILALTTNAFAIDQVVLKNGDVIEGKILSDVPNRHVDIQLVNGNKKRYQQTDVASVERDVPSNVDSHMSGSTSEFYFGPQLGLSIPLKSGDTTDFVWGARLGFNSAQLGDFAKLAFGLTFTHDQNTQDVSGISITGTSNIVLAQMLFRKVGNTGFYFGPELGFTFGLLTAVGSTASITGSIFTFGLDLGYDYYINSGFSFGPSLNYMHATGGTLTSSTGSTMQSTSSDGILILLNGTFHL